MRIRIITDSTSDLPAEMVTRYQIGVMPVYINFGTESYHDTPEEMPRDEFYRRALSSPTHPTTSASSPGDAETLMRAALADADHVIAIHCSPTYSSIYNNSRLAAQAIGEDKVTLVDSGSMSMGLGWQVIAAAEAAGEGQALPDILKKVADVRARQHVWAALNTLENLKRSGRVGWLSAGVGTLLQIKPIILLKDGQSQQVSRVRTFKNAFHELIKYCREQAPLERLALLHTHDQKAVEELCEAVREVAPAGQTCIVDVSAALGTHLGQGALGVATVKKG